MFEALRIFFGTLIFLCLLTWGLSSLPGVNDNLYHRTTFAGKPVFGKVNHDGTYSFYSASMRNREMPDSHIATLPSGEAAKLH